MNPVVPTTACTPLFREPDEVLPGGVDLGEVDRHLGAGLVQCLGPGGHLQVLVDPGHLAQVDAGVERIDRRDELELGIVAHRLAHGRAHPATGAEHSYAHHGARP